MNEGIRQLRFTTRDLMWLTAVATGLAWWLSPRPLAPPDTLVEGMIRVASRSTKGSYVSIATAASF